MRAERAALALFFSLGLAQACAPSGFEYRVPEVVDETQLFARLTPTQDGELVLANFWASW